MKQAITAGAVVGGGFVGGSLAYLWMTIAAWVGIFTPATSLHAAGWVMATLLIGGIAGAWLVWYKMIRQPGTAGGQQRKPGQIVPLERDILIAAANLRATGAETFHGFGIAQYIRDQSGARLLTGHGTLYRALARLEEQGHLESEWEDPAVAAAENRPRRKYYKLTATGVTTVESIAADAV